MEKPLISVIVPAFNAEKYIAEAVSSILAQDPAPDEVIIVNDGSTDNTGSIAESFDEPVRCFVQENTGAAAARNMGIRQARGDILAFLDADDIWLPGKLSRQLALLAESAELGAVFAHAQNFSVSSTGILQFDPPVPGYVPGTMLARRSIFDEIGPFSEDFSRAEAVEFFVRLRESGLSLRMLPEVFLHRRIHGENLGVRKRHENTEYLHILKQMLDRKRRGLE